MNPTHTATLILICWALSAPGKSNVVITSIQGNGTLSWTSSLSNATHYVVEWSPGPDGPWLATWDGLDHVAATGTTFTASVPMFYRVVGVTSISAPTNMAFIPGAEFQMGDTYGDGLDRERPVHSVQVSPFFMDVFEVRGLLWDSVESWATSNGYVFDGTADTKIGSLFPMHFVSWYDAVKWCNARSEQEGLDPVYYTSDL